MLKIIKSAMALLERSDRFRLWFLTAIQMSLGLLDLAGVAAVGLVTVSLVSAGAEPSSETTGVLALLPDSMGADIIQRPELILIAAALLLILRSILSFLLTRRTLTFLAARQIGIVERLTSKLFEQDLPFIQRRSSQETAYALMGGVQQATLGILAPLSNAMAEISLLTLLGLGLLTFNTTLTLILILYFGLLAGLMHRLSSVRAIKLGLRTQRADISSLSVLQDTIATFREITVLGRKDFLTTKFVEARGEVARTQANQSTLALIPKYTLEAALIFGAIVLGVFQIASTSTSEAIVTIVVFFTAGSRIMPSIVRLQTAGLTIHGASAIATKTLELNSELMSLPTRPDSVHFESASRPKSFRGVVHVDHVSVKYAGSTSYALRDVTFKVVAGEFLAVAGPSGAGKSTLADTILGLIQPTEGTVTVSEMVPNAAFKRWPGKVAYVPQSSRIVSGTILENICLGLEVDQIDRNRVDEILELVRLTNVVGARYEFLDTQVGELGSTFSGGERQRLGLARALYSRPSLLILDEATSALDATTEQAIAAAIDLMRGQVTVLMIAHRLSTIRNADRILYLDLGEVVAEGTFDELRRDHPKFAQQVALSQGNQSKLGG